MREVLKTATNLKVTRIYGYVTKSDIEKSPFLLDWYRGFGFDVIEPDGKSIFEAKKMVVKTLLSDS